jgi:hypothetical protein
MGRPRLIAACLGVLALYVVLPASAALAATAPPGNSEVNQYAETLPSGGGENTVNPPGSGPGGGGGGNGGGQGQGGAPVIPPQTQRQLERLGPDGRAAAALAEANAPQPPVGARGAGGGGAGAGKGDSVADAVTGALTGSDQGGMGAFLPIALFGVAGLGIGYALARRRARQLG